MLRKGRSLWQLTLLGLIVPLALGCAIDSAALNRALLAGGGATGHGDLAAPYIVYSPDILDVHVLGRPDWDGLHPVNPDGHLLLAGVEGPRVDGHSVAEITRLLADKAGVPESQVQVAVAEYNSQHLYVQSEAPGLPQVVPFHGSETIVEFLQRVGGVAQRGAPHDIQVVRSHVADGCAPEVFHVDLAAILLRNDPSTNVTLESFDQIYIGQSRGSCFLTCVPPWLRPLFGKLCGVSRNWSDRPPRMD